MDTRDSRYGSVHPFLTIVIGIFLLGNFTIAEATISITRLFGHQYNGQTWGVRARGDYLYVGNTYGLYTWNIANITEPVFQSQLNTTWTNEVVDLDSITGLIGSTYNGLITLNLSTPSQPSVVSIDPSNNIDQIVRDNSLVYVADRNVGIKVYTANASHSVSLLYTIQYAGAQGFTIYNNRIYIASMNGSIGIYWLRGTETEPQFLGSIATNGMVRRLLVRDNILYAANQSSGVTIWDVTNAASATELGHWSNPTHTVSSYAALACDLQFYDKYLFVADCWGGIVVLDITNPRIPREVLRYEQSSAVEIRIRGNYLFVADYNLGFTIFRITEDGGTPPPAFQVLYPNGGEVLRTNTLDTIRWESHSPYAWVSILINYNYPIDQWQVVAYQASNNGCYPWVVTGYDADNVRIKVCAEIEPESFDISDNNFSMIENVESSISDRVLPISSRISYAYPNPFNATTTISFSLPKSSNTHLDIFDSRGQLIETLLSRPLQAGEHRVQWNAEGNASGTYFYRLTSENQSISRRIILVK